MIDWTDVRNLIVYPAFLAGGMAWAVLFALRYRSCAAVEVAWSAAIGLALSIMGAVSMFALWLRVEANVSASVHNGVFTFALFVPAVVLVIGAVRLFWLSWRRGGKRGP